MILFVATDSKGDNVMANVSYFEKNIKWCSKMKC